MYTTFYVTEHKTNRRIWVYLPADYAISGKNYPVLYMQDGQNLFDVIESFSGEWGIDEYLDSIDYAGIVIGIDNGGETRILEYNPNDTEEYGKGLGAAYLHKIVAILKPYVDRHFRTLSDKKHTAIAGSSMGGLISFYAGLYHPDIFGSIGVFSPSFWLVPDLEEQIREMESGPYSSQRFYLYAGGRESKDLVERIERVSAVVKSKFQCEVQVYLIESGTHSEASWKRMFRHFTNG